MERLTRILGAWRELGPDDQFAGLSLEQFEGMVKQVLDAKEETVAHLIQLRGSLKRRHEVEQMVNDRSVDVVLAMRSHPNHGGDSPLVKAAGFVPKSERRSGLTRKRQVVPSNADGKA